MSELSEENLKLRQALLTIRANAFDVTIAKDELLDIIFNETKWALNGGNK